MLAQQAHGRLESEVLLCHVLGVDRAWLYANGDRALPGRDEDRFRALLRRRAAGEPVAYLTGVREFWSLPIRVSPDVLIPRPETELLVEAALEKLPPGETRRVADLGTGSGAIAIAIALERPGCEVHATEVSPAALAVARGNGETLAPGRVVFHEGSWLEPLAGRFDLVVSNPPYVAESDPHLQRGDCAFEPKTALTPGGDGLSAIRTIAREAIGKLVPTGCLAFEHGYDQGPACRALLAGLGYEGISSKTDLEGRERVTLGSKPA